MGRRLAHAIPALAPDRHIVAGAVRAAFGLPVECRPLATSEWRAACDFAASQDVASLFDIGIDALDSPPPVEIRRRIRAHRLTAEAHFESCLAPGLRDILQVLHAKGLDPIVLKGGALAYLAYPKPELRTMRDVDLLLPVAQLDQAAATLEQLGFQTSEVDPPSPHHLKPYYAPDCRLSIELHHRLLQDERPFSTDLPGMIRRAQVGRIAGIEARVLSPADMLLHVCLHLAAKHRYRSSPFRSLVDILAMATRLEPVLDWESITAMVKSSRTAGPMYWSLAFSHAWLGAPIPEPTLAALAPPAALRRVLGPIADPGFVLEGIVPGGAAADSFYDVLVRFSMYAGCPPHRQAWAFVRGVFPPPEVIFAPPEATRSRLRYAAYLLRPGRLWRGLSAATRFALGLAGAVGRRVGLHARLRPLDSSSSREAPTTAEG